MNVPAAEGKTELVGRDDGKSLEWFAMISTTKSVGSVTTHNLARLWCRLFSSLLHLETYTAAFFRAAKNDFYTLTSGEYCAPPN